MTPVLAAAKYNNYYSAHLLVENGANLYVVDNMMYNVLHHAIENENTQMIKFFISKDQKFLLRREKNINGQIPMEIEKAALFMTWLFNIWDAVKEGMIQLVQKYIKDKSYDVN
jgi:ankyrin repeat protein